MAHPEASPQDLTVRHISAGFLAEALSTQIAAGPYHVRSHIVTAPDPHVRQEQSTFKRVAGRIVAVGALTGSLALGGGHRAEPHQRIR